MKSHNQDPILNQQWNEPPHLQPPMRPMNIPAAQAMNDVINTRNANSTTEVNVENSATRRQVEVTVDEGQRPNADGPTDIQPNMTRPAAKSTS